MCVLLWEMSLSLLLDHVVDLCWELKSPIYRVLSAWVAENCMSLYEHILTTNALSCDAPWSPSGDSRGGCDWGRSPDTLKASQDSWVQAEQIWTWVRMRTTFVSLQTETPCWVLPPPSSATCNCSDMQCVFKKNVNLMTVGVDRFIFWGVLNFTTCK